MSNSGRKIVHTLKLYDVTAADWVDPPQTKPNTPGDPDYISPSQDLTACPFPVTLQCPVMRVSKTSTSGEIQFEFSIPRSAYNNPAIKKVVVGVYLLGDAFADSIQTLDITDFDPNYFKDTFDSLSVGSNYSIGIQYQDEDGDPLHTCDDIVTVNLPAPAGEMRVTNSMPGATITVVGGVAGYALGGPVGTGGSDISTHSTGSGAVTVTITGTFGLPPGNIAIEKNGVQIYHKTISLAGTDISTSISYLSTDDIHVSLNIGA